jgi:hypothetical protein
MTSSPIIVAAADGSIKQAIRQSNENDKPTRTGSAVPINENGECPDGSAGAQSGARRRSGA